MHPSNRMARIRSPCDREEPPNTLPVRISTAHRASVETFHRVFSRLAILSSPGEVIEIPADREANDLPGVAHPEEERTVSSRGQVARSPPAIMSITESAWGNGDARLNLRCVWLPGIVRFGILNSATFPLFAFDCEDIGLRGIQKHPHVFIGGDACMYARVCRGGPPWQFPLVWLLRPSRDRIELPPRRRMSRSFSLQTKASSHAPRSRGLPTSQSCKADAFDRGSRIDAANSPKEDQREKAPKMCFHLFWHNAGGRDMALTRRDYKNCCVKRVRYLNLFPPNASGHCFRALRAFLRFGMQVPVKKSDACVLASRRGT